MQTLKELTSTWIHGIKYKFSVACAACTDLQQPPQPDVSRCFHLLPLEECLNKAKIKCKEKGRLINTQVYKKWFQHVGAEESTHRSEWLRVTHLTILSMQQMRIFIKYKGKVRQ